jgi:hypothetical protein
MNIIANIPQVTRASAIDSRHTGRIWQDGKFRTLGNIGHSTQALTRQQLMQCAPSIFADAAHSRTSQRYSFLPTSCILDGMEAEGWVPTLVQEQNVRDESREGFQKHMIRFAHRDDLQLASTDRPEIVLINAHDRSSAYQLHCGIFRTYCMNGLVVCDATFARRSIIHTGFDPSKVIEASVEIVREIPQLMDGISEMKALQLTEGERQVFAEAAALARWEDLGAAPVRADKLLTIKRTEDAKPTLWNTFNTVQENLIKGGQKDYGKRKANGERMPRTRAVKGIDGNIGLNKALWHLAEQMKALKA